MTPTRADTGELRLAVAELAALAGDGVLAVLGLGSCVALVLYDEQTRVGGMVHVMLPDETMARDRSRPGKFAGSAVVALLASMEALGASRARTRARLIGGASMFASLLKVSGMNIGQRNVEAIRDALENAGIPVDAEDVGSDYGRSVRFDVATGRVEVRSLKRGAHDL
jgi:chemotaxis protein CheD